jgi:hypothetical protein
MNSSIAAATTVAALIALGNLLSFYLGFKLGALVEKARSFGGSPQEIVERMNRIVLGEKGHDN